VNDYEDSGMKSGMQCEGSNCEYSRIKISEGVFVCNQFVVSPSGISDSQLGQIW
jgi:hypothetical protein